MAFTPLAIAAAIGLVGLIIGAVVSHLRAGDPIVKPAAAVVIRKESRRNTPSRFRLHLCRGHAQLIETGRVHCSGGRPSKCSRESLA
ncbi:DoxX family protein [Nocardia sp. NPDC049190]|uniref:DoxX family protein n=1 Tax=Nocardia sp. NPDC049190 TaxID=3155650 RepID=UPI0033D372EC